MMLEPLPLTPFETLMWLDERRGYPMTFFIDFRLRGALDRRAFTAAVDDAANRHPLLRAKIARGGKGWEWHFPARIGPRVVWADANAAADALPPWFQIDAAQNAGPVMQATVGPGASRLVLEFHHTTCDGLGALGFLADVWGAYDRREKEFRDEGTVERIGNLSHDADLLAPLDESLLANRGTASRAPAAATANGSAGSSPWLQAKEALAFLTYRPTPLAGAGRSTTTPDASAPFAAQGLSEKDSQRLRDLCRDQSATLNDLLMRDLFLTIRDWNRARGGHARKGRMRVTMPVNMRRQSDRRMPAANMMSYAFLQRNSEDCNAPERLLRTIADETKWVVRENVGQRFLDAIGLAALFPRIFGAILRMPNCFATAVLSNLGDPARRFHSRLPREGELLKAGNVVIEEMYATPPVRPKTRIAIAVTTYAGRIGMAARGCGKTLGPAGTADFLAQFVKRLESTAVASVREVAPCSP